MTTKPIIKNNTVILSLEEYEKFKNEIDTKDKKIKDLETVINDKGRVLITRYDINPSSHVQEVFVNYILETYGRLVGNKVNQMYEKYGSTAYDVTSQLDEIKRQGECMRKTIESFCNKYLTTVNRADYSKEITKVINFEDVEKEIKEVYNHKYFEEFGERIHKLQEDEKECQAKLEKLNQNSIIKSYKERFETMEDKLDSAKCKIKSNERYINDLEDRIKILERELKNKESQLELYRTTIEDQKSLHDYYKFNKEIILK